MSTQTGMMDRRLALAGLVGVGVFVIAMLAMHLFQPGLSPLDEAMSYYVHGSAGWLAALGLVTLGLGSIALTVFLARTVNGGRAGIVFLALWGISAVMGGVFPADPPGNWDAPPTLSGSIHGIAALVALIALPIGAIVISRRARSRGLLIMTTGIALSLGLLMASLIPVMISPAPPLLFGLIERVYFGFAAGWLGAVALGGIRQSG